MLTDAVVIDALLATCGTPEQLYGRPKMTAHLRRQGLEASHHTVDRLMRDLAMNGVRCGKKLRTTVPAPEAERARDLLERALRLKRSGARPARAGLLRPRAEQAVAC